MGSVEIRLQDLFGSASDLIVLPCSTTGTISRFTLDRLKQFNIPFRPPARMSFGSVVVHPFEGGENLAQYVAYAASVENNYSTALVIESIGQRLGNVTRENEAIRFVTAPLLGTGAGRLGVKAAAASLADGFKRTAHDDARLVICVMNESLLDEISRISNPAPSSTLIADQDRPIRVFISYSQGNSNHSEWVANLGTFLRKNGIDARLDQWHLRVGMDLQYFMQNELKIADRVILIADRAYAEKADGRLGGVGWETMLIQGDIKDLPPESTKYLVIVRDESFDGSIPLFLKTKFAIHWPGDNHNAKNEKTILKEIFNAIDIPPLGSRPLYL